MGSNRAQFSDSLQYDKFGVITGSSTVVNMPDELCQSVMFKADEDNNERFLLGEGGSGLTFWELGSGDSTPWIETSNLNRYCHSNISGSAGEYLQWWLQK